MGPLSPPRSENTHTAIKRFVIACLRISSHLKIIENQNSHVSVHNSDKLISKYIRF